jgi:hypothetical protein
MRIIFLVDPERIKEVGIDRAAAEWILRLEICLLFSCCRTSTGTQWPNPSSLKPLVTVVFKNSRILG